MLELYTYFRSSACFRVRIALNLKGLKAESHPIHLVKNEQLDEHFLTLNPDGLVPVLVDGDQAITQSLAICEYLDERYPDPPLIPGDALSRARIRAMALGIACEIHPLNNLRVLRYLKHEFNVTEAQKDTWYRHWVEAGLKTIDQQIGDNVFACGPTPTLADVFLVPQVFNARRFDCDLQPLGNVSRVYANCMALPAFTDAAPENQPDAQ